MFISVLYISSEELLARIARDAALTLRGRRRSTRAYVQGPPRRAAERRDMVPVVRFMVHASRDDVD